MEKYLNFLIEPLIGAGRQTGEADNMSMLLQMLDTITTSYRDALDPSNNRIHLTARIARQVGRFVVFCSALLGLAGFRNFTGAETRGRLGEKLSFLRK